MLHTYLPDLTPLPIELTCSVTGVALWRVNGTTYTLTDLTNEAIVVLEQTYWLIVQ